MTDHSTKNTIAIVAAIVLFLLFGGLIAQKKLGEIADLSTRIDTATQQEQSYHALIAHRELLLGIYKSLSAKYLAKHTSVAGMETSFTQMLSDVCARDHVGVVGVNYGAVNGSAPPAPAPQVDKNGQPLATQTPEPPTTADGPLQLGGQQPGDPKTAFPSIDAGLFTRVPATITLKGQWRDLAVALQDLPRGQMLIVVSAPDMKRYIGDMLTLSFQAQILTPAVSVLAHE